ncbi:MAG: 23S rRNA (pseudouridine(1915)-N(3))-methyltransferase RlmH, partial [Gemmiger sp.]|nr:23S rRNA (pseudouridine(1915)-N(3))-methyltransferase RlmH [Gemmiger sp.]
MQNIDLIAIGKMNAAYFAQGVAEYQKRLGGFCNFRIIELPEVQIADKNASDRQIA